MKKVKKLAEKTDYKEYVRIMEWFIIEENRHSQMLKRYMEIYNIEPITKLWIDNIFRCLRRMLGIECEIIVLVTAEMIALSYYDALAKATNSKLLKTICAQMLNDELKHVILQSDTLHRISKKRYESINNIVRFIRKIIMKITTLVVWKLYKEVFIKGGYTYKMLQKNCSEYLNESIIIEKNMSFDE